MEREREGREAGRTLHLPPPTADRSGRVLSSDPTREIGGVSASIEANTLSTQESATKSLKLTRSSCTGRLSS